MNTLLRHPITNRWHRLASAMIASLLLLSACGGARLDPIAPGDRILAFGDSLTAGVGSGRDNAYPAVLQRMTSIEVINAGVSGETSAEGRQRLPAVLDEYQPDLVILCHGGNDFLRRQDTSATKANLAAMIELMQSRGIQVVLIGVPEPGIFLSSATLYAELADQYDIPIDNDTMADLQGNASLKSDRVHLNAAGYQQFAEAVSALLSGAGALP